MSDRVYLNEALLSPVSPEMPAGRDLRFEPVFTEILDARRGNESSKAPDWRKVADRSLDALYTSKDLRLCCFLTEAGIILDGFPALRDCLRLTRELLTRFWDRGLYPLIEDGDLDYRSGPLSWFNERLSDTIQMVPITARADKGENYGYSRFLEAQRVGTEEAMARLPSDRLAIAKEWVSHGCITMDAFSGAMDATGRNAFDGIYKSFKEARRQFFELQRVVDDTFGTAAPSFAEIRTTLKNMRFLLAEAHRKKHPKREAPVAPPAVRVVVMGPSPSNGQSGTVEPAPDTESWKKAEELVRTGRVDEGLAQLKALAAMETSGRARFLRQLTFVDICRNSGRERLARTILEELNRVITEHKLEAWEGTDLVGAVWSRLYRLYKASENDSEREQAGVLYNQLSRLDPWQTYIDCED
jgi:type VI secretion system protein ImpA